MEFKKKRKGFLEEINTAFLTNHESYINYCLMHANDRLKNYNCTKKIKEHEELLNIYENIEYLKEPKNICLLDSNGLTNDDLNEAYKCVLDGKLFSEHTAAGEATRLGLGTKYLLNISRELPIERISDIMTNEKGSQVTVNDVLKKTNNVKSEDLLDLSLGTRHMIQFSFDIAKLAKKFNYSVDEVLKKQKMLIVLNERTYEKIIKEFVRYNFFGFNRENIMFMVQESFHGITFKDNKYIYDENSPKRLHNHGQMVMQQTIDNQIFKINSSGNKKYLSSEEYGNILKDMENKISYNIEDLDYLTGSIDYESLAFALKKSKEGYRMLMEIVSNNKENPQKGGMAAFDNKLQRNVMIEGFQLKGIKNHEIKYLNKNFNHFPKPYESWLMLKKNGLNMPITVKNEHLYFQPVQGDINFLVTTEFFRRTKLKPIKSWKSPATTPLAVYHKYLQDKQEGFTDFCEQIMDFKVKKFNC
ncbi:MAG: hypothetical protein ACLFPJ_03985 [Candidatus Woesearchaeota archaeon]